MKKIFSFILLATMSVGVFADVVYCDPASTDYDAQGTCWEDALTPYILRTEITGLSEGDTVFFKGGTIPVSQLSELWKITQSVTFIGGFDPAATGTATKLPDYPSATPTIFTGDANNSGTPDKGDAQALIRVDFSGNMNRVFRLQGFDLVNTYYDSENPLDSPKDELTYDAMCAALRIMCGTAFVSNCRFYNHITTGRGSQCVTSVGAKLHMIDCDLRDGISVTRGGLLRLRKYFIGGDTAKAVVPDCVLERCALYNGNNMGGDTLNSAGFYGGAVQVSYGPFFAINTTIANSKGYSDGGGLNANTSGATLISCTVANNMATRGIDPTSETANTYGSNFHIDKDGVVRIANSMVLGPYDNGDKKYAVMYSSDNKQGMATNCISGGYNITGTYFYYLGNVQVNDQTDTWLATDNYTYIGGATIQHMSDYLGANPQMEDNGGCSKTMKPLAMQNGDNVAHLQQLADQWCPSWTKVDASVDQRGYKRDASVTCVGALAMENMPSGLTDQFTDSPIHQVNKIMQNGRIVIEKNGRLYNILGAQL